MNSHVASTFAVIDDQILDVEDPETTQLEDAVHWTRVYAELLRISTSLQAAGRLDSETLQRQADMYRRQLAFRKTRRRRIEQIPDYSARNAESRDLHTGTRASAV